MSTAAAMTASLNDGERESRRRHVKIPSIGNRSINTRHYTHMYIRTASFLFMNTSTDQRLFNRMVWLGWNQKYRYESEDLKWSSNKSRAIRCFVLNNSGVFFSFTSLYPTNIHRWARFFFLSSLLLLFFQYHRGGWMPSELGDVDVTIKLVDHYRIQIWRPIAYPIERVSLLCGGYTHIRMDFFLFRKFMLLGNGKNNKSHLRLMLLLLFSFMK